MLREADVDELEPNGVAFGTQSGSLSPPATRRSGTSRRWLPPILSVESAA